MDKTMIKRIWLTDEAVCILAHDGREGMEYYANYPSLLNASEAQRNNYRVSWGGLHWDELDEDLSFDGFFSKA